MSNFKSNLRDIEFNLFEVLNLGELYGKPPYENTTEDDARAILGEAAKFADEVFGEIYEEGDKIGCQFENGEVTTPPSFKTDAGRNQYISGLGKVEEKVTILIDARRILEDRDFDAITKNVTEVKEEA